MGKIDTTLYLMQNVIANQLAIKDFAQVVSHMSKDRNMDINKPHKTGWTLLAYAIYKQRQDIVELLLNYPNIKINQPIKKLIPFLKDPNPTYFQKMNKILLDKKETIITMWHRMLQQDTNNTGIHPFFFAVSPLEPNIELAKLLINKGVSVNPATPKGVPAPLLLSVHAVIDGNNKHYDMVDIILKSPTVDVNTKDNESLTALELAINHKNVRLVKALLSHPNTTFEKASAWIASRKPAAMTTDETEILNLIIKRFTSSASSAATLPTTQSLTQLPDDETTQLAKILSELQALEKEKTTIDAKKQQATQSIKKNQATIRTLNDKLSQIDGDLLTAKQQEVSIKQASQHADLKKQIDSLEDDLKSTTATAAALQEKIKTETDEIKKIKASTLETETHMASESKNTVTLNKQIEQYKTLSEKQTIQLDKATATNTTSEKEITQLAQEIENKKLLSIELDRKLDVQRGKLKETVDAYRSTQEKLGQANVILEKLTKIQSQPIVAPHHSAAPTYVQPYPLHPSQHFMLQPPQVPQPMFPQYYAYPHPSAAPLFPGYQPVPQNMTQLVDLARREQQLAEREKMLALELEKIKASQSGNHSPLASPQGFMQHSFFPPAPNRSVPVQTLSPNEFFGTGAPSTSISKSTE